MYWVFKEDTESNFKHGMLKILHVEETWKRTASWEYMALVQQQTPCLGHIVANNS